MLNNGVPTQVDIYRPGSESRTACGPTRYLNDTARQRPADVNAGLRFDRHLPIIPRSGAGRAPVRPRHRSRDLHQLGAQTGVSYDLTGDARTVVRPASAPSGSTRPPIWRRDSTNATTGWELYAWSDVNGNGFYDTGEQRTLLAVNGGRAATVFDPDVENTYVRQLTSYVEREVGANFGIRTGIVWNGRRQVRGQINVNRPLDSYTSALAFRDPGPDGRLNTTDDGQQFTGFNLPPDALALPVVNITTNLPGADSDYYTWEITATKRETGFWSLQASYAQTWIRETALAAGSGFTPNAFINTDDERLKSTTWQGKLLATLRLPAMIRLTPTLRHQSGTPFGRVFAQNFNWGVATIRAEPIDAQRSPNLTVFDIRSEKAFQTPVGRITGFFDVYNVFNTNAEQQINTTSGSSYLRPIAITPPRIARVGVRFVW